MQKKMNLKIKFRESFRPFAPAILEEHLSHWFSDAKVSPFMLLVFDIKEDKRIKTEDKNLFGIDKLNQKRSLAPAITHIDYSARVQSVSPNTNPKFYSLIKNFYNLTKMPIVVNTSFNVRGEPIVCTPEDAYRCFMRTDMDYLALGNFLIKKSDQRDRDEQSWKELYELD
jgi:carbamoyltransferase